MKKENIKTLIIFIILCLLIIFFLIYDNYDVNYDIDRKVNYIFEEYTYSTIMNKAESLFQNTMDLLMDSDTFIFEEDASGVVKYAIEGKANYKKILNMSLAINTFTDSSLTDFMDYKHIIYYENNYYIIVEDIDSDYVGSMIEYDSYNNGTLYFNAINYYCPDYEYTGILYENVNCNYYTTNTTFTINYADNFFKINNLDEFINIIK